MTLLELAERCEKAKGESLWLFREIGQAVWPVEDIDELPEAGWVYDDWLVKGAYLEAAIQLVPGRPWRVCTLSDRPPENFQCNSGWFVNLSDDVFGYGHEGPIETVTARAATAALALVAAALRARSSIETETPNPEGFSHVR